MRNGDRSSVGDALDQEIGDRLGDVDEDEDDERADDGDVVLEAVVAAGDRQVAQAAAAYYGAPQPQVTGQFREGDVRAAWADISTTRQALGWEPHIDVETGITRLCQWIDGGALAEL